MHALTSPVCKWEETDCSLSLPAVFAEGKGGLELLTGLLGLMVPKWEDCWVRGELQLWHCCCWAWWIPGRAPAAQQWPCYFTSASQSLLDMHGSAEQNKRAEVLGKHTSDCIRLQHKEDTRRWTFKGGGWWKRHFSFNRNEGPWSRVVT